MATTTAETFVGVEGSVSTFALDAVLQYGAHAPLPATATNRGLVSEGGVTINGSRSITNKLSWGGNIARSLVTESNLTATFELIQINDENTALASGTTKNAVTAGFHWNFANTGGLMQIVIDANDKARNRKTRYWFPNAEITEVAEIKLASGELVAYGLTITAYPVEVEGEVTQMVQWDSTYTAPAA